MTLPTYNSNDRRQRRFGEKTKTFSVKIPETTIQKIRDRNLDMPKIIFDMVEQDLNPYGGGTANTTPNGLCRKLVSLMREFKVDASHISFTQAERDLVSQIVQEEEK